MNQQILDYIFEQRKLSFSDSKISNALVSVGWKEDDINNAFESINSDSSSPLPMPAPVASTSPSSHTKYKFAIFLAIFLVIVVAVGVYAFGLFSNPPEPISNSTIVNANPIIAYLESYPDNFAGNVVFYDTQKQEKLSTDPVIQADGNSLFQLGPWSPDGRYLPILGFHNPGEDTVIKNLYLFDSQEQLVKKLYGAPGSEENFVWASPSFNFAAGWIDDSKLVVHSNRDGFQSMTITLTYFTIDGEMGTQVKPYEYTQKSTQLTHSVLSDVDTQIQTITVGDKVLSFSPEGEIVGIVNNKLVVLEKPEEIDLGLDFDGGTGGNKEWEDFEAQLGELEKQGVPEEELRNMVLDFIEPKGETTINLYNLETGEIETVITLTDGPWQTQSVLVRLEEPMLIAHQTDSGFLPTNERYVAIYLSDPIKTEILYKRDLLQDSDHNFFGRLLTLGVSFGLSSDEKWIIGERGSITSDPENSSIFMLNITTKEEVIVCSQYCSGARIYSPLVLESRY